MLAHIRKLARLMADALRPMDTADRTGSDMRRMLADIRSKVDVELVRHAVRPSPRVR